MAATEQLVLREVKNEPWLLSREAFDIYAACMYRPDFAQYTEEMNRIRKDPAYSVFACTENGENAGIIVLRTDAPGEAEITAIAVREGKRRRGIGSFMVAGAMERLGLSRVYAETDDDAAGFYQAAGFTVTPFTRHFPDGDVTRYRCERKAGV